MAPDKKIVAIYLLQKYAADNNRFREILKSIAEWLKSTGGNIKEWFSNFISRFKSGKRDAATPYSPEEILRTIKPKSAGLNLGDVNYPGTKAAKPVMKQTEIDLAAILRGVRGDAIAKNQREQTAYSDIMGAKRRSERLIDPMASRSKAVAPGVDPVRTEWDLPENYKLPLSVFNLTGDVQLDPANPVTPRLPESSVSIKDPTWKPNVDKIKEMMKLYL